jgi:hypothetical protein
MLKPGGKALLQGRKPSADLLSAVLKPLPLDMLSLDIQDGEGHAWWTQCESHEQRHR